MLLVLALAQQLPQAYQVAEIQAMAAIRALEFRTEVGVCSVLVKGDFELVVKALKHDNPGLARMSCC